MTLSFLTSTSHINTNSAHCNRRSKIKPTSSFFFGGGGGGGEWGMMVAGGGGGGDFAMGTTKTTTATDAKQVHWSLLLLLLQGYSC